MSILRSEVQVALNELHVAIRESADLYHFVAGLLQNPQAVSAFSEFARERDQLAAQLAESIRASGDLPGEPDRDREAGEEVRERLEAMIAADQTAEVIEHRRSAERDLLTLLDGKRLEVLQPEYTDLLARCRSSVERALDQLAPLTSSGK